MSEIFDVAKALALRRGEECWKMDYDNRDYLQEAKDIISRKSMLLCERQHLIALNQVIRDMLPYLDNLAVMVNSFRGEVKK